MQLQSKIPEYGADGMMRPVILTNRVLPFEDFIAFNQLR